MRMTLSGISNSIQLLAVLMYGWMASSHPDHFVLTDPSFCSGRFLCRGAALNQAPTSRGSLPR